MTNEIPDVFSESAQTFAGALIADGAPRAAPGPPAVAVDSRGLRLVGFSDGAATLAGDGDEFASRAPQRVDDGGSSVASEPLVDLADTGAAAIAWIEQRGPTGLIGVQERRADGVEESTDLSAPRGGGVAHLVMGGSGRGDALLAWRQGSGSNAQLAAAVLDAPPDPFLVFLPNGWQRRAKVPIAWDHSPNAIGGVRYSVSVDDEPVREGLRRLRATLKRGDVGNGRHRIQIFATDDGGQETGSLVGHLLVDRRPPRVKLRRHGRRLTIVVSDGRRGAASTLRPGSVRVALGGSGGKPRRRGGGRAPRIVVTGAYPHAGRYRLRVQARDRAGNRTRWTRTVRVR